MTPGRSVRRITNAQSVETLKPRADRYIARDTKVSGLELRVSPDGTKTWTLRYRINGLQRRLKLGEYDRLGLADARTQANRELRKVDAGIDPQAQREAARRAAEQAKKDSIDALCESYIEKHAKPKLRRWREVRGTIHREILPRWKGRPVSSIVRRDCRELIQAIADRGAPIVANRTAALLSRLFRFAVDEEIIASNPAAHLPKPGVEFSARPEGDRQPKPYTPEEIRAIWTATEALEAAPRALYRLGLLTGQRPSEIGDMEWAEVDGAWWTIPAARAKNNRAHRVALTAAALEELARVPRLDNQPRVFRLFRGKRQLSELNAQAFAGVRRRNMPRHAMRDTVATGLAQAGVSVEDVARILNHARGPAVTRGYVAHEADKEKRAAMLRWDRRLRAILDARPDAEKVVPIRA